MNMFISAHTWVLNSARPQRLHNSKLLHLCLLEWDKTLHMRVVRGNILTVTEYFSKFNRYTLATTSLTAKNQTCKLSVLKNVPWLRWDCWEKLIDQVWRLNSVVYGRSLVFVQNIHARAQALCKTRLHWDCTCKLRSSRPLSGKLSYEIISCSFRDSKP